jgi:hypothetical protein
MTEVTQTILLVLIWGTIATLAMTAILLVGQNVGWSRLSMPFLLGAFFTDRRREANVLGMMLYVLGGWLFAFVYFVVMSVIGRANWWIGTLAGFIHALLLLALVLPMLPYIHPRMASEYDGPDSRRTLEPPGFLGLHYGYRTPLVTAMAQISYGLILGAGFSSVV